MFKVAYSLCSNINQSVCITLVGVLYSQSEVDSVAYKHHSEFQNNEKIIPMLLYLVILVCCLFIQAAHPGLTIDEFDIPKSKLKSMRNRPAAVTAPPAAESPVLSAPVSQLRNHREKEVLTVSYSVLLCKLKTTGAYISKNSTHYLPTNLRLSLLFWGKNQAK